MMGFLKFLHRGFTEKSQEMTPPMTAALVLAISAVFAGVCWYIWALVVAIFTSVKLALLMVFAPPVLFILITYILWGDLEE